MTLRVILTTYILYFYKTIATYIFKIPDINVFFYVLRNTF